MLAREDEPGDKRLVAYYTVRRAGRCRWSRSRRQLTRTLASYMVPAAYVQLRELPLSPNGKLDRRALPAPDDQAYATREYEAPQGAVEVTLARIWSEVLRVERVGRHDNFFELGGHSLLAMRVLERMRREGLSVDVRTLFLTPSLSELAQRGRAGERCAAGAAESDHCGVRADHPADAAAGAAEPGGDRPGGGERARWGAQRAGHLRAGAAAGGDPVPPPAARAIGTRMCCGRC